MSKGGGSRAPGMAKPGEAASSMLEARRAVLTMVAGSALSAAPLSLAGFDRRRMLAALSPAVCLSRPSKMPKRGRLPAAPSRLSSSQRDSIVGLWTVGGAHPASRNASERFPDASRSISSAAGDPACGGGARQAARGLGSTQLRDASCTAASLSSHVIGSVKVGASLGQACEGRFHSPV